MSLPQTYISYSVDEYLALEREAEERSKYLDGRLHQMASECGRTVCAHLGPARVLARSCSDRRKERLLWPSTS